jgi:hypothetical protein
MTEAVLLASSARAVVLVLTLAREIRLRRALETCFVAYSRSGGRMEMNCRRFSVAVIE